MDKKVLFDEYNRIIALEESTSNGAYTAPTCGPDYILGLAEQLESIVRSGMVPRCCATRYGPLKNPRDIAYESVSAHTNLVKAIVDRVLAYRYGSYFYSTGDRFCYREIMAVIERHDLPENLIGDIADNGKRPDKSLAEIEHIFLREYSRSSPSSETDFEKRVHDLQVNYEEKRGFSGRLIFAADKVAAILVTLGYDAIGFPPKMSTAFAGASEREKSAMKLCDFRVKSRNAFGDYEICRASEMWTIDFLKYRELYQYDDTGLITAILVMETLIVNERWYSWREKDYQSTSSS